MYSSVISGDDWQKFVVRLLYSRYGSNLIEVPDQHKGDHGIEAFTTDGCAYQCYAPEGDVGPAIIAERHKIKITNDGRTARLENVSGPVHVGGGGAELVLHSEARAGPANGDTTVTLRLFDRTGKISAEHSR